jgi:hypothetical protein
MKLSATRKILSTLLAWILTFSSLPLSVIAENIAIKQETNENTSEESLATDEDVFIVQEDTTKRGEFEKHYICSDGTYVVASYAEAIHYKDDNGEWVDVDNRPVQTTEGDYTARNGNFGISVPSSTGDGHLMRMDKGEHSLSWTLSANKKAGTIKMDSNVSTMAQKPIQSQKMQVNTSKRPEVITSNSEQPRENHKVLRDEATFDLPNVSGKVRYDDLFGAGEGVSVVYTTYRNKIEEDIYIEKPTDITSFSMEVAAPDLTPRLNADNSVDFLDNDGKMCYHVGIPYMMDADFAVLNDIETTVIRSGDIWVITYTPDAEWFTSEERVYPILLDPSITTNEYRTNMQDTYVEEGDNTVHSSEQFLYINGGTGNRKAVIRFLTLPAIDDTMPLISASLTLYSQYSPFSDVFLKLSYSRDNISTSISSYTYAAAANATSLYTSYGTLVTGSTSVTFNLTNCVYEMYESGRDDLILGYSNESDTTFCYPFHSVDTTTNYKPTLKVVYGYSLPETENSKLGNSKIIALRNVGTGAYMTANESLGSNVYQQNVEKLTNNQRFRMKYMSDTGGYRLCAIGSSSGKVVGIQPTNGIVYGTKNVSLYTPDNPNTQEWLIIPVSANQFRIVSRTDTAKCLTAYPGNAGSATTTAASTTGNVYAATVSEGNINQIWYLTDPNNNDIYLDLPSSNIDNGEYYITNAHTGRYLYKNGAVVKDIRGMLSDIGANNVGWRITNLGDGYCTLQTLSGMYYAYADNINAGSQVKISALSDNVPDNYKWRVTIASGGGILIQNKFNNYYLTSDDVSLGQSTVSLSIIDNPTLDTHKRHVWRIVNTELYKELSGFNGYHIDDDGNKWLGITKINVGELSYPSILATESSAYFADPSDFIYDVFQGTANLHIDGETGKPMAVYSGQGNLLVTHKTTGISKNILVTIETGLGISKYPELFISLLQSNCLNYSDIQFTDDGFFMLTKPLSSILNQAGITRLYQDSTYSDSNSRFVINYYDDWYIYSIANDDDTAYSLVKMREQENDPNPDEYDNDDPGVTISFVGLDCNELLLLINDNSLSNNYSFLQNLDQVTGPGSFPYDGTLADYFAKVESVAPYLIAELYIELIVTETCVNGVISAPQTYLSRLERIEQLTEWIADPELNAEIFTQEKFRLERIPNALADINEKAGYSVYNASTNTINISNPNNLTIYEKHAILAIHTANVTFNSFAAEVEYHAEWVKSFLIQDIPFGDNVIYDAALRADMAMGEETESGITAYNYYDLDSAKVQAQAECHGEY